MNLKELKNMIIDFEKIPRIEKRNPTFLEIAGFPHYENVISNILAFYFDTNESHGLEDLFVNSIKESVLEKYDNDYKVNTISVNREVLTNKNKRIDIIIETENEVFCIENKIFAVLYNDLEEYSKFMKKNYGEKKILEIVLSLEKTEVTKGNHNFKNIQYSEFIKNIEKNMGSYLSYYNDGYSKYLLDFLQSIKNLKGDIKMNKEIKKFFIENWNSISDLKKELKKLEGLIKNRIKNIQNNIDLSEFSNINNWIHQKRCVVHDIELESKTIVALDFYLELNEPYFKLFIRKNKEKIVSENLYDIAKKILSEDFEINFLDESKVDIIIKNKVKLNFEKSDFELAKLNREFIEKLELEVKNKF